MAADYISTRQNAENAQTDEARFAANIATMVSASTDAAIAVAGMSAGPSPAYYAAWKKCRDLGAELSKALAETGDHEFAFISPAGTSHAICFGQLNTGTVNPLEYPVQTVDRLATRLSIALDDWAEHTNWTSVAYIYPASTGRGVWYRNMTRGYPSEASSLVNVVDRCRKALEAWDDADDTPNASDPTNPVNIEVDASRRALLDYRPQSLDDMKAKATAMLSLRNLSEWDDLDRAELIRAFAGSDEVIGHSLLGSRIEDYKIKLAAWFATSHGDDLSTENEEFEAFAASELSLVEFQCVTEADVQQKVRFTLENRELCDSVGLDRDDNGVRYLTHFLRSLKLSAND